MREQEIYQCGYQECILEENETIREQHAQLNVLMSRLNE